MLTRRRCRRSSPSAPCGAPTGIRNRALIMLLYRSGLRISEALSLKPSDIDMKALCAPVVIFADLPHLPLLMLPANTRPVSPPDDGEG